MEENKMKNIFKILAGTAFMTALAACSLNETPVFDDKDAFVAMDRTSIIVNEDAGTVSIPVTIASVNPMKTSVTYEVVDGSAKKGTNYNLTDESAVLLFDGESRTMNIVIDIENRPGKADGDLTFTVNIVGAGNSLNLGANASCSVKISDLDHPLADILGAYTVTAKDFAQGEVSWTMTLSKDDNDPTMVWIDAVCPLAANIPMAVYANVSGDHKTISIPCGQTLETFMFCEYTYDNGHYVTKTGSVTMTSETPGVFTTEQGIGIVEGNSLYGGGVILQGTTVWTKK